MSASGNQAWLAIVACCLAPFVAGCGSDSTQVNPVPIPGAGGAGGVGDAASDSALGGSGGSSGTGGTGGSAGTGGGGMHVREVITRDLWENFDRPDNLMLDGGLEFSGSMATTWGAAGYEVMKFGNGAVCRTGLRCGMLPSASGIYGFFVSPQTGMLDVVLHSKPTLGSCKTLQAVVLDAYDESMSNYYDVNFTSALLGSDGWCEVRGQAAAMPWAVPVLYLQVSSGGTLIDDVVVTEAANTTSLQKPMAAAGPRSAGVLANLRAVTLAAREALRNPAKRARMPGRSAPWTAHFPPFLR